MEIPLEKIIPRFPVPSRDMSDGSDESPDIQRVIHKLNMQPHIEGGYFVETHRDQRQVSVHNGSFQIGENPSNELEQRSLSTCILYFLTPKSPIGRFHRHVNPIIHTCHYGRGIYVILKDMKGDGNLEDCHVETFVVGSNIMKGERLQWVVDGGSYRASFLLPDDPDGTESSGLLITEVRFT